MRTDHSTGKTYAGRRVPQDCVEQGFDFLGYRIWHKHLEPHEISLRKACEKLVRRFLRKGGGKPLPTIACGGKPGFTRGWKDTRWDVHFEDSFFDDVPLRLNNQSKYRSLKENKNKEILQCVNPGNYGYSASL